VGEGGAVAGQVPGPPGGLGDEPGVGVDGQGAGLLVIHRDAAQVLPRTPVPQPPPGGPEGGESPEEPGHAVEHRRRGRRGRIEQQQSGGEVGLVDGQAQRDQPAQAVADDDQRAVGLGAEGLGQLAGVFG